jgi:hypothetical protein
VEQPAQPFSTSDGAIALLTVISRWHQPHIALALMGVLLVIMLDILL